MTTLSKPITQPRQVTATYRGNLKRLGYAKPKKRRSVWAFLRAL